MKNDKWYHVLKWYIKQYRLSLVMFIVFVCIFAVVFSLYNLETEAVLYAAGLCLLFSVIVLSVRFVSYLKQHRQRQRIIKNISILACLLYTSDAADE